MFGFGRFDLCRYTRSWTIATIRPDGRRFIQQVGDKLVFGRGRVFVTFDDWQYQ